jgi:hypothetical protein
VQITVVGSADLPELLPLVRAYCDFYQATPSDQELLELSRALLADPQREGLQLLARDDAGRAVGFATLYWTWQTLVATRPPPTSTRWSWSPRDPVVTPTALLRTPHFAPDGRNRAAETVGTAVSRSLERVSSIRAVQELEADQPRPGRGIQTRCPRRAGVAGLNLPHRHVEISSAASTSL